MGKSPPELYLAPSPRLYTNIIRSDRCAIQKLQLLPSIESPELTARSRSVIRRDEHPLDATHSSAEFEMNGSKISVIVVADELLFRLGLARLLSEDERLEVIAISDGEPELIELCKATSVDVVVMDIQLSRSDSIDLVRSIVSACPSTQTLILASTTDWRVRPAMIAGAAGVLLKDTSPQAIRAAVISVHLGDQVLCNEAARWVLGETSQKGLTQRESEVFHMVAQGASNLEIAAQLGLGEKTIRNYVSRLYRKLDLRNRAQIATYAHHADIEGEAGRTALAPVEDEPWSTVRE
jgi:two-component system, NarL family, response regulator LiaR